MGHEGIPRRQIGHFSLLRSYQLADLFTLANAFAGMASILLMMSSSDPGAVASKSGSRASAGSLGV